MGRLDRLPVRDAPGVGRVRVARGFRARLLGLALLSTPPDALLFERCRSVHTFGMRWPLDLLWLDGEGAVVRVDRSVPSGRARACRRASAVVEIPAARSRHPAG